MFYTEGLQRQQANNKQKANALQYISKWNRSIVSLLMGLIFARKCPIENSILRHDKCFFVILMVIFEIISAIIKPNYIYTI